MAINNTLVFLSAIGRVSPLPAGPRLLHICYKNSGYSLVSNSPAVCPSLPHLSTLFSS